MKNFNKIFGRIFLVILGLILVFCLWFLWQKKTFRQTRLKIAQATRDLKLLKKAVLQFREKYGEVPPTLEYLLQGEAPILKELPDDPFDGPDPDRKTYYYYTSADGHFVIYSCGPNGKNDCDIDDYREASRISRSLGSGEEPKDCDDIIESDLPIRDR